MDTRKLKPNTSRAQEDDDKDIETWHLDFSGLQFQHWPIGHPFSSPGIGTVVLVYIDRGQTYSKQKHYTARDFPNTADAVQSLKCALLYTMTSDIIFRANLFRPGPVDEQS